MVDCDVQGIFLNFMMKTSLHLCTGVDLSQLFLKEAATRVGKFRGFCEKKMMGYSTSPYFVTKDTLMIDKQVRAGRSKVSNVLRYDSVTLNLPGTKEYYSSQP